MLPDKKSFWDPDRCSHWCSRQNTFLGIATLKIEDGLGGAEWSIGGSKAECLTRTCLVP